MVSVDIKEAVSVLMDKETVIMEVEAERSAAVVDVIKDEESLVISERTKLLEVDSEDEGSEELSSTIVAGMPEDVSSKVVVNSVVDVVELVMMEVDSDVALLKDSMGIPKDVVAVVKASDEDARAVLVDGNIEEAKVASETETEDVDGMTSDVTDGVPVDEVELSKDAVTV